MKAVNILIILILANFVQAKWCDSNSECGDTRYYSCVQNNCCKKSGLSCGAGYSWSCCNRCSVPRYSAWGTCT